MPLRRHHLSIGETIATVIADDEYISIAESAVRTARSQIKEYALKDIRFIRSLDPIDVSSDAPDIVQRMADAARRAHVGPLASVAGAIAQYAVEAMVEAGASHVIFDNGGDIAMSLGHPVTVGVYAGENGLTGLGLRFTTTGELLGVCTSSATVGLSLSFGITDASVVLSRDVALADAAATALGNAVVNDSPQCIEDAMRQTMVEGVDGMLVIVRDRIGLCGRLPQLVRANVREDLITRG